MMLCPNTTANDEYHIFITDTGTWQVAYESETTLLKFKERVKQYHKDAPSKHVMDELDLIAKNFGQIR